MTFSNLFYISIEYFILFPFCIYCVGCLHMLLSYLGYFINYEYIFAKEHLIFEGKTVHLQPGRRYNGQCFMWPKYDEFIEIELGIQLGSGLAWYWTSYLRGKTTYNDNLLFYCLFYRQLSPDGPDLHRTSLYRHCTPKILHSIRMW